MACNVCGETTEVLAGCASTTGAVVQDGRRRAIEVPEEETKGGLIGTGE